MTEMGRKGWSDPEKAKAMTSRIPLGRFAGQTPYRMFLTIMSSSLICGDIMLMKGSEHVSAATQWPEKKNKTPRSLTAKFLLVFPKNAGDFLFLRFKNWGPGGCVFMQGC